ncbi:MAG: hypothetical protein IT462_10545 [Planctomycetes bacterium]|nr:hypothetical protein [Planctomycetota bacterium]
MKTLSSFCALTLAVGLLSGAASSVVSAKAMNFSTPAETTVLRLADQAEVIVVGRMTGVENTALAEPGVEGTFYKRIGDGSQQDGDPMVLRQGVLRVSETLKGDSHVPSSNEIRFISIRQLQYAAYDSGLKDGNAIYFLDVRTDGKLAIVANERGIVTPGDVGGLLLPATDFMRSYVMTSAANMNGRFSNMRTQMMSAIRLDGSRLSVDCVTELSTNFNDYANILTPQDKATLVQLMLSSAAGSVERPELIVTMGRYKPQGASDALFTILLSDTNYSTSALCCWSLEQNDRLGALGRMTEEYGTATDNGKLAIVRAIGLIRPKLGYDGEGIRNGALNLIGSLLTSTTPDALLKEALIASRDLRSGNAHIAALKDLINNRATNGISKDAVRGAIIALAAARIENTDVEGNNHDQVFAEDYLLELGNTVPDLKQIVTSALKTPWTTLITDCDGNAR